MATTNLARTNSSENNNTCHLIVQIVLQKTKPEQALSWFLTRFWKALWSAHNCEIAKLHLLLHNRRNLLFFSLLKINIFVHPLASPVVASVVAIVVASFRSGTPQKFIALQVVKGKLMESSPYPLHPYTTNKTPQRLVSVNVEALCGFAAITVDCSIHPCWSCHDYYHHCCRWFCEQVCDLCAMMQPGKSMQCTTEIENLLLATLIALSIFV